MNDASNPYASWGLSAAEAESSDRAKFIRLTYLHLLGAVLAFIGLEAFLLSLPQVPDAVALVLGNRFGWFIVLGAFIGVSYIANSWAANSASVGMQYAGLSLFVVAEAVIFVPLLYIAGEFTKETGVNVIGYAALLTTITFLALTVVVFLTGADFSFLGTALSVGAIVALVTIGVSMFVGFNLGILFIGAMLLLCAGYILYDTSNVLHHYRIGQHVAASLALFASVALMFWYMVQLVMSVSRR